MDTIAHSIDYDGITKTVNRRMFVAWIRENLRINPWGSTSSLLKCPLLKIVTGLTGDADAAHANRITCNDQKYPHW